MSPPHYRPDQFPPESPDWPALLPLIGRAQRAIAGYEGVLYGVPNPDILLSPLSVQEAVLSSRIEGTQSSLSEVLALDANGDGKNGSSRKSSDAREVLNYRLALVEAIRLMPELPLSGRLIRRAHAVLMTGVRGGTAAPGEYRRIQNWIGSPRSREETAIFVTCSVPGLGDAMAAWERYLHADTPDALVQLGVLHAWFEAIHPFLDGNGRLGRLMVPLFLVSKGLLIRPNFYLSEYLERYRADYYGDLLVAQRGDGWSPWLRFFLTAMEKQAIANAAKARQILDLYERRKEWITRGTRSQHAVRALDRLFYRPVFSTSDFAAGSGIPQPTARRILRFLRDRGVLHELAPARGRHPAVLVLGELIEIVESPSDFSSPAAIGANERGGSAPS